MVLVRGLDRLDGSAIEGMGDELWAEHAAEIQRRFEGPENAVLEHHPDTLEAMRGEGPAFQGVGAMMPGAHAGIPPKKRPRLGFTEFCAQFADGALTTSAMQRHAAAQAAAPAPAPPAMVGGARGIGPAWTRGEIERPAGERDMGSWTMAIYTPEQQRRLGVNEAGEPAPEPEPEPGPAPAPPGIGANMPPPKPGQFVVVDVGGRGAGGERERLAAERRAASGRAGRERRAHRERRAGRGGAPDGAGGGEAGRFPAHWGEPPRMQTRDLRELPGGYGMGSGTLAAWITEKMAADAAQPAAPPKTAWPELVNQRGEGAVATIQAERPDLAQVLTVPEDAMVTMDWREDRVRVFVDAQGIVCREPTCG